MRGARLEQWLRRLGGGGGRGGEDEEKLVPTIDAMLVGQRIAGAIQRREGFLASRIGFVESLCISSATTGRLSPEERRGRLWKHAGVFPETQEQFEAFCAAYCGALAEVDLLGVMHGIGEALLVRAHGRDPLLTYLSALEPYLSPCPWSEHLRGLRVLVVHPFEASIRKQYDQRRASLFCDDRVLPEFDLRVVKPPQTLAGNTDGLASWSEGLEALKAKVATEPFDVAIVGCGAYGLPLGASIKGLGKPCIHLGGVTQILFGIDGGRWKNHPYYRCLRTPDWTFPSEDEKPPGYKKVEDGCYW